MKGFTSTNEPAGSFDRTIFLKINMQLSTATMRSSLDADWKMLTPESKSLLINSSMKPRPADPIFLEIAKSPDNPNRCTCAQIAPEEYNADPSCCARGTELVFTWRKNGDLEVSQKENDALEFRILIHSLSHLRCFDLLGPTKRGFYGLLSSTRYRGGHIL